MLQDFDTRLCVLDSVMTISNQHLKLHDQDTSKQGLMKVFPLLNSSFHHECTRGRGWVKLLANARPMDFNSSWDISEESVNIIAYQTNEYSYLFCGISRV